LRPAGTTACLKDHTDFPAGTSITVPAVHDFRVGDAVEFATEGAGAKLDTALTAGTTYYVVAVTGTSINVSATKGGTAITLNGDGGTGTADTAGGHINVKLADFMSVCNVQEFSLSIEREELDVSSLPCGTTAGSKFAAFRSTQSGFASGSGSMTVMFTADQASLANRILSNVLLKNVDAEVKLYVNTVAGTGGTVDDAASIYVESGISLTGMSFSVNTSDAITAEVSYSLRNPKHVFGAQLV